MNSQALGFVVLWIIIAMIVSDWLVQAIFGVFGVYVPFWLGGALYALKMLWTSTRIEQENS